MMSVAVRQSARMSVCHMHYIKANKAAVAITSTTDSPKTVVCYYYYYYYYY